MRIGDLEVIPVSDGTARLPAQYFPNADWEPHKEMLGPDGTMEISLGCFVVRTEQTTVLIDAGIGPITGPVFQGGELPGALASAGVDPAEIDLVLLTHLHLDHIGWVAQEGAPYFPNATVRFGAEDLEQFIDVPNPDGFAKTMLEVIGSKAEPITSDGEVAPGVSTIHAPGHTLGHRCVVLSSGDQRAFLLGDAVTCPVQLEESEWEAMSDVDPKLAKRTREALWSELEGTSDLVVAAHFPGLAFGRVMRGEGKRYFA